MIFDGLKFRRNRNLVVINLLDFDYTDEYKEGNNYLRFGRIIDRNKPLPANAVCTKYTWTDTKEPVWAVPISLSGWSLTNMAYGKDGRTYLAYGGEVYTYKRNKNV